MSKKSLFKQLHTYTSTQKANVFVYFLTHSWPFKHFFYQDLVQEYVSKEGIALTLYSIEILWKLSLKVIYLTCIGLHFETNNSGYLMFFIVLTVIGALNKPILNFTQQEYETVMLLRVPPKRFGRFETNYYLIKEFILFALALSMVAVNCHLNYLWLLYTLLIYLSIHLLGQALDMILYEKNEFQQPEYLSNGIRVLMMLFLLIIIGLFYGFDIIADNTVMSIIGIIFIIGGIGAYLFIYNYSNFDILFKYNLRVENYLKLRMQAKNNLTGENLKDKIDIKSTVTDSTGYKYLFKLFTSRYHKVLRKRQIILYTVVGVISLAMIIVGKIDSLNIRPVQYAFQIYQMLSNIFWAMYIIVNTMGSKFIQLCFFQIDRYLVNYNFYRNKESIIANFFLRFKYIFIIVLIPTLMLSLGFALPQIIYPSHINILRVITCFLLPIICAGFFTIFNVSMYYLFQPYSFNGQIVNKVYPLIDRIFYVAAYIIFTQAIVLPDLAIFIIAGVLLIASVVLFVLAVNKAPSKFRVR